jgi:hypothetical protein
MGLFHVHLPQLATSTQVRPVLLGEKEAIANGIIIGCFVNVTQGRNSHTLFTFLKLGIRQVLLTYSLKVRFHHHIFATNLMTNLLAKLP